MKRTLKSASILTIFYLLGTLWLTGCADAKWPTWLTGEPDESVTNAPRAVGRPSGAMNQTWPNLATVPDKPRDLPKPGVRQKTIKQMSDDKAKADEIKKRVEEEPAPLTLEQMQGPRLTPPTLPQPQYLVPPPSSGAR